MNYNAMVKEIVMLCDQTNNVTKRLFFIIIDNCLFTKKNRNLYETCRLPYDTTDTRNYTLR